MIECEACHRHVRSTDTECPFCRRAWPMGRAGSTLGAAVTTFVLAACYGTGDFGKTTTGDTAPPTRTGELLVEAYDVACNEARDHVTYAATTSSTPYDGLVYAQETGSTFTQDGLPHQYSDEHDLVTNDAGDGLGVTLSTGVDPADAERDVSTAFSCAPDTQFALGDAWMSFAFGVYDDAGVIADCLAGGHDAAGLVDGTHAAAAVNAPSPGFDLSACVLAVGAR